MTEPQGNKGLAMRPATVATLVAAATSLGLLAIGWITIRKLRPFDTPVP
ncbi:MAG: hypothetical protein WA510_23460 [Acidobacteriaceae bacterium]